MANVLMRFIAVILILLFTSCKPYKEVSQLKAMEDLTYPYATKKLTVLDDIEIAYIEQGKGNQTILFVHGLGSYLPAWKKNIDVLSSSYKCIAIDLPGYGKSSKGKYAYDMKFFADVLGAFIREMELRDVTLVGHSMGGQISITTALYYEDLVDRLILVAPAGFETFHEGQKEWFRGILTSRDVMLTPAENIQANIAYNFYDFKKDAEFMISDRIAMRSAIDFEWYCYAVVQSVKGMVDQPVFDFLKEVEQPTLVLFGENDNLIPNRYLNPGKTSKVAEKGVAQMPNASLRMIPNTGHFAMFESAELVNNEIMQFLR